MTCAHVKPLTAHLRSHGAALLLGALLATACSEADTGGLKDDDGGPGPRAALTVMTRNIYLGSELTTILMASTPAAIPGTAAALWERVQASDVAARMELVAAEIAVAKPDVVGLQEVEIFRTDAPSNFDFTKPAPNAATKAIDFLQLLQERLTARGLSYEAFENPLSDAELPAAKDGAAPIDVRMTDRDVILVRAGITHGALTTRTFKASLPVPVGGENGGVTVNIQRGFTALELTVDGAPFTFVNSHLEVGLISFVQTSQARELVTALDALPGTLIVAGDFNSDADGTGTASYGMLTKSAHDAWPRSEGESPGFTCCGDLDRREFGGSQRIDLVFYRGPVRAEGGSIVGTTAKTQSGLFASDHAGVVMKLSIRKPD